MVWRGSFRGEQEAVLHSGRICTRLSGLSDEAEFAYKCTDFYHPGDEGGMAWNDPEIGVEWPIEEGMELIISEKDQKWGGFRDAFKF